MQVLTEVKQMRHCLSDPIPEICQAAAFLDEAVTAHLEREHSRAYELIRKADMPVIHDWCEELWGPGGPHSKPLPVADLPPWVPKDQRPRRHLNASLKSALVSRDGF